MPFDGMNAPFRGPYRGRRSASSSVQRALRGWKPIQRCERARRWKLKAVAFLRLLGLSRRGTGGRLQ
jgi:hypothetical protein